jgi:hypothetical protein
MFKLFISFITLINIHLDAAKFHGLEKLKIAEWSRRDDLWKVGTKLNFSS